MDNATSLLLSLSLALACGLMLTRLLKLVNLPNVTAYLVAGLIVSPYTFGILNEQLVSSLNFLSSIALGFIAFSIGFCFKIDHLKVLGGKVFTITLVQAIGTAVIVDLALFVAYLCGIIELPAVFVLGAIATATAPAATLMVIHQYNAHGIVTDTLLPVVAIDDAVGLILFSISLSISQVLASGEAFSAISLLNPLREIGLSLALGLGIGFVLSFAVKIFKSRANRLSLIIASVFCGVALSELWELSSLLLCMMIGAVYCNVDKSTEPVMEVYDRWTHPLYVLFFVISGAGLDIRLILSVGVVGIIYLVSRSFGKYGGAFLGAKLSHADKNVQKYLGLTLLPQAGVAIGMSQIVITALPEYAALIRTVVLCATLIYELIGPLITKTALTKAGEILPHNKLINPTPHE